MSAKCKGSVRHYPGKIFKKNDDGSFDIKFDDGDRDRAVPKRSIKPSESKSPRRARDRGSTSEDEGGFAVGDKVTAKCKGSTRHYPGKIYKKNDDGSFDIKFDDGDRDRAIPKRNIKSSDRKSHLKERDSASESEGGFSVGEKVSAKCKGSVRHYPGKIFKRNDDGSFDIKFDDGDRDKAVPKRYIKPSESKSPRRERDRGSTSEDEGGFAVGEKVSAKCKGSVRHYPGKIFKKNDDGSFDIKFDDGDRDRAVPKRSIKPSESKSPRRARDRGSTSEDEGGFAVGEKVTAKCKGRVRH